MKRFADWPTRLNAYIEMRREWPFAWHTNDCSSFAAKAVEAITGQDVFAPWAAYADAASAIRLVQSAGGVDRIADRVLGQRIGAAFAQRGDVVLIETEARPSLAVCLGGICAAPGLDKLEFLPMGGALCGWRV